MTRNTIDGPTLHIERLFKAPIEKVWAMWTTKEGLEKWYWPAPLAAKVLHLDVRVGGSFEIAAVGLTATSRGTFTEVLVNQRLGMLAIIDFLPGLEAYDRADTVELQAVKGGTKMVFTCTRMHAPEWTERAIQGWQGAFEKLAKALHEDDTQEQR
jgi:uncharacterized protein YndB with AHSA1/START domain